MHDVCPEYEADVKGALLVCDDARTEWPMIERLQGLLPGEFNISARDTFSMAEGAASFNAGQDEEQMFKYYNLKPRAKQENPKMYLLACLSMLGEKEELIKELANDARRVVAEFEATLEIAEIIRPADDILTRFRALRLSGKKVRPVGKVVFRPAIIESEFDQPIVKTPVSGKKVTLFFDDAILRVMKKGMKMTFTLAQLDNGFCFVKNLVDIAPTFHTMLPQELMKWHKPPAKNERPGPSIHGDAPEEGENENGDGEEEQVGEGKA